VSAAVTSFNFTADDSGATIRLHLSENPFGNSSSVRTAILEELDRSHIYPDPDSTALRSRLAAVFHVDPSMVLVSNGCDELVLLAALAFAGPQKRGVTTAATFPGYRTSMTLTGASVDEVPLRDFRCDLDALALSARDADAVFLCNPHNPTGSVASASALSRFLEDVTRGPATPIIDEAYIEFCGGKTASAIDWIRGGGRAIVLRTLSKAYGIAGLRVGVAVGDLDSIGALKRVACALPFRVNRFAQAAGLAAIDDPRHLTHVTESIREARNRFCRELDDRGFLYVSSETNFVMVRLPMDTSAATQTLREHHRVLIRDCGPFGLPGWVRISLGTDNDMMHLLRALESLRQ
jgi:histidinol-phosphate aminotransferase